MIGVGALEDTPEDVRDQARLIYVAMTRAKQQLAMTASQRNSHVAKLEELVRQEIGA